MQDFRLSCGALRDWQHGDYSRVRLSHHPLSETLRQNVAIIQYVSTKSAVDNRIEGFMVDLFTLGLIEIDKTGRIPIWCVAQCQILMDMLEALGQNPDIGHGFFLDSLARSSNAERWEKIYNGALSRQAQRSSSVENCGLDVVKRRAEDARASQHERPEDVTGVYAWPKGKQPETLATAFPQLACLRVVYMAALNCNRRIIDGNNDVCLLAMAYVYRAAQNAGLLSARWEDMETLIMSQSMHRTMCERQVTSEGMQSILIWRLASLLPPSSRIVLDRYPASPQSTPKWRSSEFRLVTFCLWRRLRIWSALAEANTLQ